MYNLIMRRRRKIKEEEEEIREAEIISHWSPKRIGIALLFLFLVVGGGIYIISLLSRNPNVLGQKAPTEPRIKIPDERDIEDILERAEEELSNVNAENIIESQPKLKKIIDDLSSLTSASNSAKKLICESLCK